METQVGTAKVTGSYLGVTYDVEQQALEATCLEGACSLSNAAGTTDLSTGQATSIQTADQAPSAAEALQEDQIDEWVKANP